MQEIDIADLERAATPQLEVVALRCEANACKASESGVVPLVLISSTGKDASAKRKAACKKRADRLAKSLDEGDGARAEDLGDPRFLCLVLGLCYAKVHLGLHVFASMQCMDSSAAAAGLLHLVYLLAFLLCTSAAVLTPLQNSKQI